MHIPELPIAAHLATAVTVAVLHTVQGPDHYLPLIALRKARGWTRARTAVVTMACGVGHCASAVLLLLLLVMAAGPFDWLALDAGRGPLASWLLVGLGMALAGAGLRRRRRGRGIPAPAGAPDRTSLASLALFLIFVLGPCEWLLPGGLAAFRDLGLAGLLGVCGAFSAATVATMLLIVLPASEAAARAPSRLLAAHATTLAGVCILLSGLATALLPI